jgi:ribulose 1,5-bisphosphate synthetase/thiazole synthase
MAKTATKTTKKVSTAKGKGKAPKATVVKKGAKVTVSKAVIDKKIAKANKPAVKKVVAKKPAVKRAPKEVDPNKYGKFVIVDTPNDKYPTMVTITTAPAAYSSLVGKKYVSRERFITFIEGEKAEVAIDKGAKSVAKELDSVGLLPMEPADTDEK